MNVTDLWSLVPELYLTGLGLLVLLVDLFLPQERKSVAGWIAIAGLLLTLIPSAAMLTWTPRTVVYDTYVVDGFGAFFKLLVIGATILVILTSLDYFRPGTPFATPFMGEMIALYVFMALGMVLMAASADLILLTLSIEFVSLTSYVMAGFLKADPKSNEAGVKYFLFGAAASAVMLYGFSLLYGLTGSTNLYVIAERIRQADPVVVFVALAMSLAGFGFKISMVPFHQWTPDIYEGAPTPVAAYLSVGSKAAGFAAFLRTLLVSIHPSGVDWAILVAVLSAITMTIGNLLALPQRNIKRMLAYSSISHAGFILIGVAAFGGTFSNPAVLLYLLAYMFTNLGAFFVAMVVSTAIGSEEIPDFAGLARRAPVSAFAMALFMLSLTGIPPTAVFLGKFYLLASAIEGGLLWLAVVAIVNSVISLYYYVGVIRAMYLLPPAEETAIREPPILRAALTVTMVGTLIVGLYPEPFVKLAHLAAMYTARL
jgi:proton-translocating NADH-quinone oxidoreductase chain N